MCTYTMICTMIYILWSWWIKEYHTQGKWNERKHQKINIRAVGLWTIFCTFIVEKVVKFRKNNEANFLLQWIQVSAWGKL